MNVVVAVMMALWYGTCCYPVTDTKGETGTNVALHCDLQGVQSTA